MRYDEIPPAMREALAAFEMLRRLGFPSKDIFFHQNDPSEATAARHPEPPRMMFVVLRTQGKDFTIRVGVVDLPYDAWKELWTRVAKALAVDEIPKADRDRLLVESEAFNCIDGLRAALARKGFKLPIFDVDAILRRVWAN